MLNKMNEPTCRGEELVSSGELEDYHEKGYLIVHDLLSDEEIDTFLTHGRTPAGEGENPILRHKTNEYYRSIATAPRIISIVRSLVGGSPMIVQSMLLDKEARGGRGISLHQDAHHIDAEPNTLMACWIALTDTDGDNGGLCVVPGSHRGELLQTHPSRDESEHDNWDYELPMRNRDGKEWMQRFYSFEVDPLDHGPVEQLVVPRGTGVFFSSLTVHGSYANRSANRPRIAFATHYVREGTWVLRSDLQELVAV
jgi:phytanoyl-CoA hydroxylase